MKVCKIRPFDIFAGIILALTAVIVIINCRPQASATPGPTTTPTTAIVATTEPTTTPATEPTPTTEPTIATEPEPMYSEEELEMLACVIYQEAGGNACCDDCRRRVADVVLNRVNDERFPDTMYEVLTAKRQYGRFYWTGIVWPDRAQKPEEAQAVERAYRIAEEVLTGYHSELYGNGYIWQAEFKQGNGVVECCGTYFGR